MYEPVFSSKNILDFKVGSLVKFSFFVGFLKQSILGVVVCVSEEDLIIEDLNTEKIFIVNFNKDAYILTNLETLKSKIRFNNRKHNVD